MTATRAKKKTTKATTKTMAEVAFAEGQRRKDDANIIAVGYGAKLRAGTLHSGSAVVFYVREKLASPAEITARGSEPIPDILEGFATDVVRLGEVSVGVADRTLPAGTRGTRIDAPLIGGSATTGLGAATGGPGGYGTLGGLCFDNTTGNPTNAPLVLSNAHVWGTGVGTEVAQPVLPTAFCGAKVSPAVTGGSPLLVQTRIPPALGAPVVFANAVAQTYLIAGGDGDPLSLGQSATAVPGSTRTDVEQVSLTAPVTGLAPAGKRLLPTVAWSYRRLSTTAVLQASSSAAQTQSKLLTARRLFTSAASYSTGQVVNLYAEIVPVTGGGPASPSAHYALVLLYPLPAGDRIVSRVLKSAAKQTPPSVTAQFTGFPSPAKANAAAMLPVTLSCGIGIDGDLPGTFKAVSGLPTGTLALQLPSSAGTGPVRVFVPPSTTVVLDIDPNGLSTLQAQGKNSAGDDVGTVVTTNGTGTRKLVTVSGSEIVEVSLTGAGAMLLCGVTSTRKPNIESAPLQYAGAVNVSDLGKGHWGASLFVQALDSGLTESANVVETAIGVQSLIADCQFDIV